MAIDKESNAFTFLFAGGLVVVVGLVLSVAAMSLKPFQVANVKKEKMQDVLAACNIDVSRADAEERFGEVVTERLVLDSTGEVIARKEGEIQRKNDSTEAFNIDPRSQLKNVGAGNFNRFALFVCEKDGENYYVIPMAGKGLWGPIWGYICLESDMNTVYGAVFDHDGETPGLGAEIASDPFQDQFTGLKIFDENGEFVSIDVRKSGVPEDAKHAVDGITGGTVTSHGVRDMMDRTLSRYVNYFKGESTEDEDEAA